jgi:bifunctional NMN adenylyltransferase/nudix hydrolase
MAEYKAAVFIGRFQPFHLDHLEVAKKGLEIADQLIFVLGSANSPATVKNPWSFQQRKEMIMSCFKEQANRVNVIGVRDYFYSDATWVTDVKNKVGAFVNYGDSIALVGNVKDDSSYYLKYFPEWDMVPVRTEHGLDATNVRKCLFSTASLPGSYLPAPVKWIIENEYIPDPAQFTGNPFSTPISPELSDRMLEYNAIKETKKIYGNGPFITTDAVVVCEGHILLVKRGQHPGKGLWALPGGFLRGNERIKECVVRELLEETGIRVNKKTLEASLNEFHVFDHPGRSSRGRTVTHAYLIKLDKDILSDSLPEVKGADDAAEAKWIPLMDLGKLEQEFFEDHLHLINHFMGK